jgi:hypothetical protein
MDGSDVHNDPGPVPPNDSISETGFLHPGPFEKETEIFPLYRIFCEYSGFNRYEAGSANGKASYGSNG